MARHQCARVHFTYRTTDLQNLMVLGLQKAGNVEDIAIKLFADFLRDTSHEIIHSLQYDPSEDAWIADVAFFVEGKP